MLIITRRTNEAFTLEDAEGKQETVTVTVLHVEAGNVRIGITAPKNIHILRDDAKKLKMNKMESKQESVE